MEDPTAATMQALDSQIAPLQDQLITLRRSRNELVPISCLPAELLAKIFLVASTGFWDINLVPNPGPTKPFRRGAILLSQVSWAWRTTALASPEIWKEIYIFETTSSRLVKHYIRQSNPLPIRVAIQHHPSWLIHPGTLVKPRALKLITHLLNNGIPRLRHLAITMANPNPLLQAVNSTLPCVASLETLLIVSRFRLSILEELELGLPDQCPNLRAIFLPGCFLRWSSPLLLKATRLDTLDLLTHPQASLPQLHKALSHMPDLRNLLLHVIPNSAVQGSAGPDGALPRILIPKLHKLKISGTQTAVVAVLRLLRIPPLAKHFIFKTIPRSPADVALPTDILNTKQSIQEILGELNDAHSSGLDAGHEEIEGGRSHLIAPAYLHFKEPFNEGQKPMYSIFAHEMLTPGVPGCTTDISLTITDVVFNSENGANPPSPSVFFGMRQNFPFTFSRSESTRGWYSYGWSLSRLRTFVSELDLSKEFWEVLSVLPTLEFLSVRANHSGSVIHFLSQESCGLVIDVSAPQNATDRLRFPSLQDLQVKSVKIGPNYLHASLGDVDGIQWGNDLAQAFAMALEARHSYLDNGTSAINSGDADGAAAPQVPACNLKVVFSQCVGPLEPTIREMFSKTGTTVEWNLMSDPLENIGAGRVAQVEYDSENEGEDESNT